jgi:hypothetical protein
MTTGAEARPDFEELAKEIRGSVQLTNLIREIVREELGNSSPRERRAGLPQSEMQAAMARLEERRKKIALPPEVVEAILEEHRREFGRGPLVDEPGAEDVH